MPWQHFIREMIWLCILLHFHFVLARKQDKGSTWQCFQRFLALLPNE